MNKLELALRIIDDENSQDPKSESFRGEEHPKEWLYGKRMSDRLTIFLPDSSDVLKIAARAQHIRRWDKPRNEFPMERSGYLKWRSELGKYHGEVAARIMNDAGYDEESCERVKQLLRKEKIKKDPEVQNLEDVICLVFLEHYLENFIKKHEGEKLLNIIRKTWAKMSDNGHTAALALDLPTHHLDLVKQALGI